MSSFLMFYERILITYQSKFKDLILLPLVIMVPSPVRKGLRLCFTAVLYFIQDKNTLRLKCLCKRDNHLDDMQFTP